MTSTDDAEWQDHAVALGPIDCVLRSSILLFVQHCGLHAGWLVGNSMIRRP